MDNQTPMNIFRIYIAAGLLVTSTFGQRIVNESWKRSVFLTGSIVREEHVLEISVDEEASAISDDVPEELARELHRNWFPNYVFVIPPEQAESLSAWDAALIPSKSNPETVHLATTEITSEVLSCQK